MVINCTGLGKSSRGQLSVDRHGKGSGGLLEAGEDRGSLRADCKRPGKTVGARAWAVRSWGGGERQGVDEIGCGELRREPHKRAREGGRPPDMGGDGLGSEGGAGRAERVGSDVGGKSNAGKTWAEYVRGLRESRSLREVEVMLVWFRMRNGFRARLVTGLKERGYHGKKAGGRGYRGGRPGGETLRPQDVQKRAA